MKLSRARRSSDSALDALTKRSNSPSGVTGSGVTGSGVTGEGEGATSGFLEGVTDADAESTGKIRAVFELSGSRGNC